MAVDNSAAESARSLLNGIDYSALIGGPLQAAITAQAMAAKSTWEFIQQVGLDKEDADGNRKARTVSFVYQRDGEMVTLLVPLLVIVPIPLIVVDEISIDFTASINASASSTTEDVKSQDIGGELEAEGSVGWGPFSLKARMKASYSSKQSSKATQDSRYSVEYTQVVRVHARQADVPAGLATVLNILSSAATGGTMNGELNVSPALATVSEIDSTILQMFEIKTRNANGVNVASDVAISLPNSFKDCFVLSEVLSGNPINWTAGTGTDPIVANVKTGKNGSLALNLGLKSATTQVPAGPPRPILTLKAKIKGSREDEETFLPINVLRALPSPTPTPVTPTLTFSPTNVAVTTTTPGTVEITGIPASPNADVTAIPSTDFSATGPAGGAITLDANSKATVTITYIGSASVAPEGDVAFSATLDGQAATGSVTINSITLSRTQSSLQLSALQAPSGALSADADDTRQVWIVGLQDGEGSVVRAPVHVRFDPTSLAIRYNEDRIETGRRIALTGPAERFEIEILPGAATGTSRVTLEAQTAQGTLRRIIPVRIP